MKIEKFRGLDNVHTGDAEGTLEPGDLIEASNVDVRNDASLSSRAGFAEADAGVWANLWKGSAIQLGTLGSNLVNAATETVLHASAGTARMWFGELPDGRVVYSNGTVAGVVAADGATRTGWGVPVPSSAGAGADTAGSLADGEYRWCVTHRRTADGLEGGPIYSGRLTVTLGGIALTGLPALTGHSTRVYITTANGTEHYFAGTATAGAFTLTSNASRAVKCMTHFCKSPEALAGKMPRFWRGRMLLAVGDVLYASQAKTLHLFNVRKDFRKMAGTITMVEPVTAGIWVGTTAGLFFLGTGATFDALAMNQKAPGAVVLGSGVQVPGEHLMRGEGVAGKGNDGVICIANRHLTACYPDGSCMPITQGRYQVAANVSEVRATFREDGATSQYIAIPQ